MVINFVANYQTGYVGEIGDANHLVREMEALGHSVRKLPQDEWREHVIDNKPYPNIPKDIKSDINIICKWHHFYDGRFIEKLREESGAPVFYWVWDFMWDEGIPDWHLKMVEASNLYLGNDVRSGKYPLELKDKLYYFPFDVADGQIERYIVLNKKYDTVFFGSWIGQGSRQEWLTEINKTNPITVFTWNPQEWPKEFDVHEAVYGDDFAKVVSQCKIILGFSVEPSCWGYWSNRVGKVLTQGGFLLYQYAPGMELFLRDGAAYFSSIEEAREKIDYYLIADSEREAIAKRGCEIGQRFTSKERIKDLMILIERYLMEHGEGWQI